MFNRGRPEGWTCHHLSEAGRFSQRSRELVELRAHDVWEGLQRPGGGELNCIPAAHDWLREFLAAGIPARLLAGGGTGPGRKEGGYRLADGTFSNEHFWLAVDENLALFDPTGAQFAEEGAPELDRYWVMNEQSFVAWREAQLAAGSPHPEADPDARPAAAWRDRVFRRE